VLKRDVKLQLTKTLISHTYLAGDGCLGLSGGISRLVHYVDGVDDHVSILNELLLFRWYTHGLWSTWHPAPPQPALFPGPSGWAGARRELVDFMVQGNINRGRHRDHPAGRHSIRTNQCPPLPSPHPPQSTSIHWSNRLCVNWYCNWLIDRSMKISYFRYDEQLTVQNSVCGQNACHNLLPKMTASCHYPWVQAEAMPKSLLAHWVRWYKTRPASADRTACIQFQATGQPGRWMQASDEITSRLLHYEAKCVQRRCFQWGSVPLHSDIKGTELPLPIYWYHLKIYWKLAAFRRG